MSTIFPSVRSLNVLGVALAAAVVVAGCAPRYSAPEPVAAENPSVTYQYRTEQELLNVSLDAQLYCSQYQTTPYAASVWNNPDGTRTVVFECVRTVPATVVVPPASPNLAYAYRTDQELLAAAQSADAYCTTSRQGRRTIASIVGNVDGSRTVTFQCVP